MSKGKGYNPPGFGFDRYLPYNMLSAITFLNEKLTRLMALEESRKVQSNSGYGISLQQKEQLRDLASFSVLTLAWIEELEFASST